MQTTALIAALHCNQEAAAKLLLERGADPSLVNSEGATPAMLAALSGSLAMVELDGGAGPNALVATDEDDTTRPGQKVQAAALIAALNCKQEAAAQLLLEHGADPNLATSRGTTLRAKQNGDTGRDLAK